MILTREELRRRLGTADHAKAVATPLPPPPAPTARDANPWRMPQRDATATHRPPTASPAAGRPAGTGRAAHRPARRRILPIAVTAAMAVVLLSAALQALERAEWAAALPMLAIVAFLLFVGWRSSRRR